MGETLDSFIPEEERGSFHSLVDDLHERIGLVIFEKRPLVIPKISEVIVMNVVGKEAAPLVIEKLDRAATFLGGIPVGDAFENNQGERHRAFPEISSFVTTNYPQLYELFWEIYRDKNQFRLNLLSPVRSTMRNLSKYIPAINTELRGKISGVYDTMQSCLDGKDRQSREKIRKGYFEMNLAEKLEVVQTYEDGTITVMSAFSASE